MRWELVSKNGCDLVTVPRIVSREVVPLDIAQARVLVNHVRGHRLEVLLTMAVVTGMRRGELLALRWSNIDFDRHHLLVLHSVNFIAKHGYVEDKPKTKAGSVFAISLLAFLLVGVRGLEHLTAPFWMAQTPAIMASQGLSY